MDVPSLPHELLVASCENHPDIAAARLSRDPELPHRHFLVACVTGTIEKVRSTLQSDPGAATRPDGPLDLPPLLYTVLSSFLRTHPHLAPGIVTVTRELLQAGADPNATWACGTPPHGWKLSALYAAAGRANHPELTRLLLEAGANPNDGESLYHSAEFHDTTCTRLLLEHGATIPGTNAVHRKLDYDDLPGFQLFLDHGAPPNLTNHLGDSLVHAVINNDRHPAFLQRLAERGADLRAPDHLGLTPFRKTALLGRPDLTAILLAHDIHEELPPTDRFLAACARGDEPAARTELERHPDLRDRLSSRDRSLLPTLAWRGRLEGVRTLLALGLSPATLGHRGETALHNACWMGHAPIAELLLLAGAPLELVEPQYRATPLRWALHGREFARDRSGRPLAPRADHDTIIQRLVAAGARVTQEMIDTLPAGLPTGLRRVLLEAANQP